MGNCIRGESSSMVWAGGDDDDDGWEHMTSKRLVAEKQSLLGDDDRAFSSSSLPSSSTQEVIKIRITKKQLEELLLGAKNDQVLSRLIIDGRDRFESHHLLHHDHHHRSWKPRLQSIPEVN